MKEMLDVEENRKQRGDLCRQREREKMKDKARKRIGETLMSVQAPCY